MKRQLVVFLLAMAIALAAVASAFADPTFGPGNSGSGGNDQCKPPGQVKDRPQC
jgi:hypothetical protein